MRQILPESAIREIRTTSHLLHPPLLDEIGLQSALQWFTSGYAERSGVDVSLKMNNEMSRLPAEYELCLFRLVSGVFDKHSSALCKQKRNGKPRRHGGVREVGSGRSGERDARRDPKKDHGWRKSRGWLTRYERKNSSIGWESQHPIERRWYNRKRLPAPALQTRRRSRSSSRFHVAFDRYKSADAAKD